jgi:competence protein ComEC
MTRVPDTRLPVVVAPDAPPAAPPPRRPVCGLAIAGCAGIAAGLEFSGEALPLLAAGGVCVLAALLVWQRAAANVLLAAGVACAGWAHAVLATHSPSGRELSRLLGRPAEYVAVIGAVQQAPVWRCDERTGENVWTFPLQLEGVRRVTMWQRATGEVECQLRLPPAQPAPRFGERWQLQGLLGPQLRWRAGAMTPAGYRLLADGVGSQRLAPAHASLYGACLAARDFCATLLGRGLANHPEQAGLLRAMLLGTREEMGEALYRDFSVTGTLHVVAVSGTHVMIMAGLLLAVLRGAGVTQPYWFYWLAPLLTLYVMMTGLAPSAVRACLMAIAFWLAPLLQRRPDGLTALAWAAVLILVWDPAQWRDVGFLLSFSAVLGLLLVYPPLADPAQGLLRGDPWRLQPAPWWQRWPRAAVRAVALLALTSLAVCLVTDPLTARYFNLLSPVALLANLAVVPAAGVMMTLGVLAMLGGAVWAPLADLFNSLNLPVISFIMRCTEWSAALPGGHFFLRSPSWWWVAAYYAALSLWLLGQRRTRLLVTAALVLTAGVLIWRAATDQTLAVHVWRLGGATIALVDAPRGDKVLVNTGPRYVTRELLRRLHAEGVGDLRALALTRGTSEHAGGAVDLLQQAAVRELWCATGNAPPAVDQLAQHGRLQRRTLTAGLFVPLAGTTEVDVLHPPADQRVRRAAERTPVFRLSRPPAAMLFLNDAPVLPVNLSPALHTSAVVLADNPAALDVQRLAGLGVREVITPASLLLDKQTRQAATEQSGIRVWRLEEGDVLHILWPADGAAPAQPKLSPGPGTTTAPTAL